MTDSRFKQAAADAKAKKDRGGLPARTLDQLADAVTAIKQGADPAAVYAAVVEESPQ